MLPVKGGLRLRGMLPRTFHGSCTMDDGMISGRYLLFTLYYLHLATFVTLSKTKTGRLVAGRVGRSPM